MASEKDDPLRISDEKFQAACKYAATLERAHWLALKRLVADALHGLHTAAAEWEPYLASLQAAGLDRDDRNDLIALLGALMQRTIRPEPAFASQE